MEEVKYINWVNSLEIEDVNCDNIGSNLTNGIIFQKILDKIYNNENLVNWDMIDMNADNRFKKSYNLKKLVEFLNKKKIDGSSIDYKEIAKDSFSADNKEHKDCLLAILWILLKLFYIRNYDEKADDEKIWNWSYQKFVENDAVSEIQEKSQIGLLGSIQRSEIIDGSLCDSQIVEFDENIKAGQQLKESNATISFYEGEWNNMKKHGKGRMVYENGHVYNGFWEDDKRHGLGRMDYDDGEFYNGEWDTDQRQGLGLYKYSNGDQYRGFFDKDKPNGCGKMISGNHTVIASSESTLNKNSIAN